MLFLVFHTEQNIYWLGREKSEMLLVQINGSGFCLVPWCLMLCLMARLEPYFLATIQLWSGLLRQGAGCPSIETSKTQWNLDLSIPLEQDWKISRGPSNISDSVVIQLFQVPVFWKPTSHWRVKSWVRSLILHRLDEFSWNLMFLWKAYAGVRWQDCGIIRSKFDFRLVCGTELCDTQKGIK